MTLNLKELNSSRKEIVQNRRIQAGIAALAGKKYMPQPVDVSERKRILREQAREIMQRRRVT